MKKICTKLTCSGYILPVKKDTIKILVFSLFTLYLLAPFDSSGQNMIGGDFGKGLQANTQSYGYISQMPMATPQLKGSTYLFDEWLPAELDFGNIGKAQGLYTRYDILNSIFYIKLNEKVKSVSGVYIKKFSLTDTLGRVHNFTNCNSYRAGQVHLAGFFEILEDGHYALLKKTNAVIIKSNYVLALDLGDEDDNISQQSEYYISRGDEVVKVPSGKKKLAALFPEKSDLIKFLKNQKINIRHTSDLAQVVKYLNQ